jgi:hypothetical protein
MFLCPCQRVSLRGLCLELTGKQQAYKYRSHCEYTVESIATDGCASPAILAQIDQIVGPDVEALGLQSI